MQLLGIEPHVRVGLVENGRFGIHLNGKYDISVGEDTLTYCPITSDAFAEIEGIEIGKQFHWNKFEKQKFAGVLMLKRSNDNSVLINILPVESYLCSVVSSEMNSLAPIEFLKAHAVISRSWLLKRMFEPAKKSDYGKINNLRRVINWTDAELHKNYDVCADDHCQRYQGLSRISENANQAVRQTRGLVLKDSDDRIIDARFSKCCGGRTELFSTCWQSVNYDYLQSIDDSFCNPNLLTIEQQKMIFGTILNDYDAPTTDYYEWEVEVPKSMVSSNLKQLLSVDIGNVVSLNPMKRGESGRIFELEIVGSKDKIIVGKELLIRKLLSKTHLYSSSFDVIESDDNSFKLSGRGWGHGVGLCQIGAAVMALKGYDYKEILQYYYKNTKIQKLYD